jgi:hypothetical protein
MAERAFRRIQVQDVEEGGYYKRKDEHGGK